MYRNRFILNHSRIRRDLLICFVIVYSCKLFLNHSSIIIRLIITFIAKYSEYLFYYESTRYASKIRDVDEKNQEVLIHFEGWSSRFDEWIDLKSSRLRPTIRTSSRKTVSAACPIPKVLFRANYFVYHVNFLFL